MRRSQELSPKKGDNMNIKIAKMIGIVTGLILTTLGGVGCKSSDRTLTQRMGDNSVAREVNDKLDEDPTFKYTDVKAIVYNGTVQLTGFVETAEQRTRAAELAAQAKGARQIVNNIMLKPLPTGRAKIRDPLAQELGKTLVDTNAPVPHAQDLPEEKHQQQNTPQPQEQR